MLLWSVQVSLFKRLLLFFHNRVLERIGARALVAHVRTFADFLVYEFSTSAGGQQLNKCIEILNDMVWKYNIVTLDRLILCLVSIALKERMWEVSQNLILAFFVTFMGAIFLKNALVLCIDYLPTPKSSKTID